MPEVQPFAALRYDLGHVGSLSDVVAPPYDVIDSTLQNQLYDLHPANVIRLILNRDEPGDDPATSRYARAAQFLKQWRKQGILQPDPSPALYVYHQHFVHDSQSYTRRGFVCRVRLEPIGKGRIFPHEETHSAAKEDRLRLTRTTQTNLSQIFGLYPDADNRVHGLLETAIEQSPPFEATDHLGVRHRMWAITDIKRIGEVAALMNDRPLFIADGHHRYETAWNYRQELLQNQTPPLDPHHPANFVMTMCVSMSDPGMVVLPTHRLFRGLPNLTAAELAGRLGDCFQTQSVGTGPERAHHVWLDLETEGHQGSLAFFTSRDQTWTVARITTRGRARMDELAASQSAEWRSLGVSILHRLVVDTLLNAPGATKPMYVHSTEEVVQGLQQGDTVGRDATGQAGSGGQFPLAALVMPATVDHIQSISQQGQRMPAKSTYFYPKLLTGLVFHPLSTA